MARVVVGWRCRYAAQYPSVYLYRSTHHELWYSYKVVLR